MIYPLSVSEATAALLGDSPADRVAALDARLDALAAVVRLGYLIEREGGWGAVAEWGESLSLGARRRRGAAWMGAARPEGSYLTAGATGAQSFSGPHCWSLSLAARATAKAASALHGFMMAVRSGALGLLHQRGGGTATRASGAAGVTAMPRGVRCACIHSNPSLARAQASSSGWAWRASSSTARASACWTSAPTRPVWTWRSCCTATRPRSASRSCGQNLTPAPGACRRMQCDNCLLRRRPRPARSCGGALSPGGECAHAAGCVLYNWADGDVRRELCCVHGFPSTARVLQEI